MTVDTLQDLIQRFVEKQISERFTGRILIQVDFCQGGISKAQWGKEQRYDEQALRQEFVGYGE